MLSFCDLTHTEYASMPEPARVQLVLPFAVTPHQFRHSGPCYDRHQLRRSLPLIKARGFGKSAASLAVYEIRVLLPSVLARLMPAQQRSSHTFAFVSVSVSSMQPRHEASSALGALWQSGRSRQR